MRTQNKIKTTLHSAHLLDRIVYSYDTSNSTQTQVSSSPQTVSPTPMLYPIDFLLVSFNSTVKCPARGRIESFYKLAKILDNNYNNNNNNNNSYQIDPENDSVSLPSAIKIVDLLNKAWQVKIY